MTDFNNRLAELRQRHEALLCRKNQLVTADDAVGTFRYALNGIYTKYKYPVLTAEHVPLEWKYDLCEKDNPYLMQRIMCNATLNSGAMKWGDKYLLIVRVEGADRK